MSKLPTSLPIAFGVEDETTVKPEGIPSTGAVGTPSVAPDKSDIQPEGIPSTGEVGTPIVGQPPAQIVLQDGIASTGSLGEPSVSWDAYSITPEGIAPTGALGTPSIALAPSELEPVGIPSTGQVGFPTVESDIGGAGVYHTFMGIDGLVRAGIMVDSFEDLLEPAGGPISASGRITEEEYQGFPQVYTQGAVWIVWDASTDEPIWGGELLAPKPSHGICVIAAQGFGSLMDAQFDNLLWQTKEANLWVPADSEPHEYDTDKQIEAEADGSQATFVVKKNTVFRRPSGKAHLTEAVDSGDTEVPLSQIGHLHRGDSITIAGETKTVSANWDKDDLVKLTSGLASNHPKGATATWSVPAGPPSWETGLVFWQPEVKPRGVAFSIKKNHSNANYVLELLGATGPSGNLTLIDSWSLGPKGPKQVNKSLTGDYDLLMLRVKRTTEARTDKAFRLNLRDLRVRHLATGDDYTVSQVMEDLFQKAGAGVGGVEESTLNALPLHVLDASLGQVADEIAVLANLHWGIYPNATGMGRRGTAEKWGTKTYYVTDPYTPIVLTPQERFNQVSVDYIWPGNHTRTMKVPIDLDPDPFPPGYVHGKRLDLEQPPTEEVAEAVAQNLGEYLAEEVSSGSGRFHAIEDAEGNPVSPLLVRPGDVLVLTNHEDTKVRVNTVNHLPWGDIDATFTNGNPILEKLLARRKRRLLLGMSNARASLGIFDLGDPALPLNATLGFRQVDVRGGRHRWDAVCKCDPVTEDVDGSGHVMKAYHWQLMALHLVGGEWVPVPDPEGPGKLIYKETSTEKDDKDGEGDLDVPTKQIFKNLPKPHQYRWQMRVRAESILGTFSKWTEWGPVPSIKPANFGPPDASGLVVRLKPKQDRIEGEWDAPDPTEVDTDGVPVLDQRIAYFEVRLRRRLRGTSDPWVTHRGPRRVGRKTEHAFKNIDQMGRYRWRYEVRTGDHYGNVTPWA